MLPLLAGTLPSVVISMPGIKERPNSLANSAALAQPSVLSWSVRANTSTPDALINGMSSSTVSAPSEFLE